MAPVVWVGVDPGASQSEPGALAWITLNGFGGVVDWPGDERALISTLADLVMLEWGGPGAARVVIEQQQSRPSDRNHVGSLFKLAANYGMWLAGLAAFHLAVRPVSPSAWKRVYPEVTANKDSSLMVARRMFPSAPLGFKKHHGRAEALLLAEYARRNWG